MTKGGAHLLILSFQTRILPAVYMDGTHVLFDTESSAYTDLCFVCYKS